jgi:cysteine desulfurase/selenocysteine lyase
MAVMSNEFPIDPLDENIISELVNQLFKAPPVPLPTEASIGAVPQSVAGSGISPSAINQGNSVDLKDPQTSLPDPHFAGKGLVPSSVAGSGASPSAASYKGPRQNEPAPSGSFPLPASFSTEPTFYFADTVNPFAHFRQPQPTHGALTAPPFDINQVRRDFPILHQHVNGHPLVWLDNAATTQKPESVIQRISEFYRHDNSNIHRAAHELAARSTDAYEGARQKVQHFLNAGSPNEIVFVRGATEAINLVAKSWGNQFLQPGDEIILSHLEHHANIVPWQQLAAAKDLKLKVIPVDDDGQVLLEEYGKLLGNKTKLVSFTQVSNALGTITPAKKIVEMAHAVGAKALVDGAQAVSHMPVDVRHLDADWYVFSGHKVFGPTGALAGWG